MAYKVDNVLYGAADIWLAPRVVPRTGGYDAVKLPTFTAGSAKKDFESNNAWTSIGLTTDGVEVEYAPEFTDIAADQLLDAAVIFKTAQTVTINTTMLEATLKNLSYVWGLQAGSLRSAAATDADGKKDFATFEGIDINLATDEVDYKYTEGTAVTAGDKVLGIDSGELGAFPEERQIAFIGNAPRVGGFQNKERVYHVRRILQTESSTFGLKRDEGTSLPVSFRALPDPAITGAQYGTIRDRKITGS